MRLQSNFVSTSHIDNISRNPLQSDLSGCADIKYEISSPSEHNQEEFPTWNNFRFWKYYNKYLPMSLFPLSISLHECNVRPPPSHEIPLLSRASQTSSLISCLSWFFANILQKQRTNITGNSRDVHILSGDDNYMRHKCRMCHHRETPPNRTHKTLKWWLKLSYFS